MVSHEDERGASSKPVNEMPLLGEDEMQKSVIAVVVLLGGLALPGVSQESIKLDEATGKKLEAIRRQDEQRKKMESQMHVTRSDGGEWAKPRAMSGDKVKCNLNPEQMRRLADTVDAARGEAGLAHVPQVIQQSKEIDKQCRQQQNPSPRKEPEPKAIHPVKK